MIKFIKRLFGQSEAEKYAADKYRLALFKEIQTKNRPIASMSNWSDEHLNELTVRMMITRLELLEDEVAEEEYQQGLEALKSAEKAVE